MPNTWALGESWEQLQVVVVVSLCVGQVSVQLEEVTVLLLDHHHFDIPRVPL